VRKVPKLQLELGITTIYVTHDQAEAMSMSDRIMVMESGVVQQIGSPEQIYNKPVNRFVTSFIGESNLWEGIVERFEGQEVLVRLRGIAAYVDHNCSLHLKENYG
jgi:iron(III) transport system ATP-binding protein